MTKHLRLLRVIGLSMVIAFGLSWRMPRLSGQDQPSVALVFDDTGSMFDNLPLDREALKRRIQTLQDAAATSGQPFPTTVLITFKDDVTTRLISNDPVQLQAVADSLVATEGGDCQESSIAALIVAAEMLVDEGELNLWTDADSRADGPDRAAIESIIAAKSLHAFYTADTCPVVGMAGEGSALESRLSGNHDPAGQNAPSGHSREWTAAALATGSALGPESGIKTFSTLALETNGVFVAIPKASLRTDDGKARYINLSANRMFTKALPTVMLVTPAAVPQDGAFTVELTGGSTNFQGSSTVSVGGSGVTVVSQTVISSTRMLVNLAVSGSAAPGFRDVTVTTNLGAGKIETARGVGPLQITTPPTKATVVGITPSQIARGRRRM